MKRITYIFCVLAIATGSTLAQTGNESTIDREFTGISTIDISTVSGDCRIERTNGQDVKVRVTHDYRPRGTFESKFSQKGKELILKERMNGSNSGHSTWTIMVPKEMDIRFKSSSGSIVLRDIVGKIDIKTSSGAIDARGIEITGDSKFTSSSGDVEVKFDKSPEFDVLIRSSSGNATGNFSHNPVIGNVEMRARVEVGTIICPIDFDNEKIRLLSSTQEYWIKSFTASVNSPSIVIHTASGEARLRK